MSEQTDEIDDNHLARALADLRLQAGVRVYRSVSQRRLIENARALLARIEAVEGELARVLHKGEDVTT